VEIAREERKKPDCYDARAVVGPIPRWHIVLTMETSLFSAAASKGEFLGSDSAWKLVSGGTSALWFITSKGTGLEGMAKVGPEFKEDRERRGEPGWWRPRNVRGEVKSGIGGVKTGSPGL